MTNFTELNDEELSGVSGGKLENYWNGKTNVGTLTSTELPGCVFEYGVTHAMDVYNKVGGNTDPDANCIKDMLRQQWIYQTQGTPVQL